MSTLVPAETLWRVQGGALLALAPGAARLHVRAGDVTRCGHRTSADWQAFGGTGERVPTLPLCPRCLAGLPLELRRRLVPTPAELAHVYELEARLAAEELRRRLADLRTRALVDGAAYERTRLVEAGRPDVEVAARRDLAALARRDPAGAGRGWVATARALTLLELLGELDPTRPDVAGRRVWLVDEPALGSPVDVGGTYDPRLWQGRRR